MTTKQAAANPALDTEIVAITAKNVWASGVKFFNGDVVELDAESVTILRKNKQAVATKEEVNVEVVGGQRIPFGRTDEAEGE